ncbi:hypothetical protein K488DRAFT_57969 [Vararia minispora EC-137]|uniref:Uncharacterized protein n=1 Tax=Vararia minispora EC-137 TaxID=1314806 RepID=A0ACB8QA31_9AGAM|nr:hypothetical protein K488DRAFT_57969 [Vararia minispora EC-137]
MMIENTAHYDITSDLGAAEYAKLVPDGGHTVKMKDGKEYTVALFHQLRCLEILRNAYVDGAGVTPLTEHCMNYLRQSILCLADTRLESVRAAGGEHIVDFSADYTCRDWTAVYEAAETLQNPEDAGEEATDGHD